jgi:flagellar basal body-associated protein FliL
MAAMAGSDSRGARGGSLLIRLVVVVVIAAGVWWFAFGALSPCEAMRAEAKRVGAAELGVVGKLAAGALTDLRTDDFTPFECTVAALKLKVQGARALKAIIARGRDGLGAGTSR